MAGHRNQAARMGLLVALGMVTALAGLAGQRGQSRPLVRLPDPDIGADSLPSRKKAQQETVKQFKVFYQFQFADTVKESGITFIQHIEEDAGYHYKPVHYDHGNGIAV